MRKKTKSIIIMGMACTMLVGVLSGCGEQAEAVNQQSGATSAVADSKVGSTVPATEESRTEAEATPAGSTETAKTTEEITDGNIVLYAEKEVYEYRGVFTNPEITYEDTNVEVVNAEADIPLYSLDGAVCGYLKEGGSIVVTESLRPGIAWSRFENPIEGTEEEYLYVKSHELIMTYDLKALIEETLNSIGTKEILDAPEADMECYEFSLERRLYLKQSSYIWSDELNATKHRTFYVECTRNGDYFDVKVYYK